MNIELKNCPCCGGKAEINEYEEPDGYCYHTVARVRCTQCDLRTRNYWVDGYYGSEETVEDAINIWNNRV